MLFFVKNIDSLQKNRDSLNNFPSLILEIFGIEIFNKDSKLNNVSICKFGIGNCFVDYHIIRNQLNSFGVVGLNYPVKEDEIYIDNTDRPTTFSNMKHYLSKTDCLTRLSGQVRTPGFNQKPEN